MEFSLAIKALGKFLETNPNKVVIAFHDHDDVNLREFLSSKALWRTLKFGGFTDNFMEMTPDDRNTYDQWLQVLKMYGKLPSDMDTTTSFLVAMMYAAEQRGFKTTFVDKGSQTPMTEWLQAMATYGDLMMTTWTSHVETRDIFKEPMTMDAYYGHLASYIRDLVDTPDGSEIKATQQRCIRASSIPIVREDDKMTGQYVAGLIPHAKGRVFMAYGDGHFTPTGIQTYVNDPIIFNFQPDIATFDSAEAQGKHPDVFINSGYSKRPAWVTSYVLTLKEGKIIELPAQEMSPAVIALEQSKWVSTIEKAKKMMELFYPSLLKSPPTTVPVISQIDTAQNKPPEPFLSRSMRRYLQKTLPKI